MRDVELVADTDVFRTCSKGERYIPREGVAPHIHEDKESHMIKPLDEYSPEDRAFVEYVQKIRSEPQRPPRDPGPFNANKVLAMLDRMLPEDVEDDEPAFRFARRATDAEG